MLLDSFKKDFPKIKTSYVRLQTGALYAKITAERSAGRFGVDVLQLSDISPAIDFQKKGGWERHVSPELTAYKTEHQSNPAGHFTWGGVSLAGIAYNRSKVKAEEAPKTWKDILKPSFKDGVTAKLATSGMQHAQWYICASSTATTSGGVRQAAAQGADAAPSSSTAVEGDDRMCVLAECRGTRSSRRKARHRVRVAARWLSMDVLHRHGQPRPHPAAKLFVDWALSKRGQAVYQNQEDPPRVAADRRRTDADRQAAGGLQAFFPTWTNDHGATPCS